MNYTPRRKANVAQCKRCYRVRTVYTMHSRVIIEGKLMVDVKFKEVLAVIQLCNVRQRCGCLWDYCVWAEWKVGKVLNES